MNIKILEVKEIEGSIPPYAIVFECNRFEDRNHTNLFFAETLRRVKGNNAKSNIQAIIEESYERLFGKEDLEFEWSDGIDLSFLPDIKINDGPLYPFLYSG